MATPVTEVKHGNILECSSRKFKIIIMKNKVPKLTLIANKVDISVESNLKYL